MRLFLSLALLLSGLLDSTLGSTLKPFHDMNMEEALKYLHEKLTLLESRETSDIARKMKGEIKDELTEKLAEVEFSFVNKHNELSAKQQELEERLSKEKKEISDTLSEFSTACAQSVGEVSERLLKEKTERLSMQNHILVEVQQLQRRALETAEKINDVKSEVTRVAEGGRNKTDMLEVKISETKELVHSCLASQRDTEDAMRKNMSLSVEILKTVANHSSEISSLNTRLIRVQNRCSDPPNVENGRPIDSGFEGRDHEAVVTYACRGNKVPAGNVTMQCHFGKWIGELPQCVDPVCSPPCQNGGTCAKNNSCICTSLFSGERCQHDHPQCGLDLRDVGISGVGNSSSSSAPAWPWMAAVFRKWAWDPDSPSLRCGGSIIHRHFILVPARHMHWYNHDKSYYLLSGTDLTVRLGVTNQKDLTHLQEYNVRTVYIHPRFNRSSYDYNIALLELDKPIDYNLFIRPVCLPPEETPEDNRFYKPQSSLHVIEWNYRATLGTHVLRETPHVIQPSDTCSKTFEHFYNHNFTDRMFCAAQGEDHSCQIAGGAALQSHLNKEGTRVWTQVGIYNGTCKFDGKKIYVFLTHLQKVMPWVVKTIEDASKT